LESKERNMSKKIIALILCMIMAIMAVGCGSSETSSEDTNNDSSGSTKVLTILKTGSDKSTEMTTDDVKKLGTVTQSYSGRNKSNNNKRIIKKYTGVDLKKLLEKAGYKNAKVIKITASDGYTKEYEIATLYDLYAYKDEKSTKGTKVNPIIAIAKEGTQMGSNEDFDPNDGMPLQLVYGQADYDSEDTKDFNMQGWVAYVEKIEVEE